MSEHLLVPLDYAIIGTTLILSAGVGIYHGLNVKKKKKNSFVEGDPAANFNEAGERCVLEYFLAGRTMTVLPVAVSFFATAASTLMIIGPAMEVYAFGLSFCWSALADIPVAILVAKIFVPLFYNMQSSNIYKFLQLRYNRRMKEVIVILFTLRSVMVGSAIIYGTSVALNEVTLIDLWIYIGTITGVCVVYTTMGGIRGVMWVDVFQGFLMISSMLVVVAVGTYHVGGLGLVWNSNYETGRLDIFEMGLDLTKRHTFWSDTVGLFVVIISQIATSQAVIHRFLTAPSVDAAQRSCYFGFVLHMLAILLSVAVGCIMYAEFRRCDPLTAKTVENMNQLVPKYVSEVLAPYPILPGLFFAGLLSACLSTLSSVFNSLATILMETFIQPHFPKIAAKHSKNVCRFLGIFAGLLNTFCVLITERFPNVIEASISCSASLDGALLGILLIGIFAPQAKFKVVLAAFLGGVFTTLWVVTGSLMVPHKLAMKPLFVDGCPNQTISLLGVNYANISQLTYYSTENITASVPEDYSTWMRYFPLYHITYQWLALIGLIVLLFLLAVLSALFGIDERSELQFDPLDFIPKNVQHFQRRLPKRLRRFLLCDVYDGARVQENGFAMQSTM